MMIQNTVKQQQLLAAIPAFVEFMHQHINDYMTADSPAIQAWLKSPYAEYCAEGKDFYRINNIWIDMNSDHDNLIIRLDMRILNCITDSGITMHYYTDYFFHIPSLMNLYDLCNRIWNDIFHISEYINDIDDFIGEGFTQPVRDFITYYTSTHKNLVI